MTYGYLRVSTDKQDVESQKLSIIRKSEELRLPVDEYIADAGVSGTKEYRDRELGILMEKLQDKDVIIVPEISRLARSVFMLFRIVEFCTQTKDCTIISVKENQTLKKNDSMSAIILSAYGTAAQIEREMIVKRVREGLEHSKQKGVMLGCPVGGRKNICDKYENLKEPVKKFLEDGVNITDISRIMGLSRTSLNNIINRFNLPYEKKRRRYVNNHVQRILMNERKLLKQMIADGKNIKTIHCFFNNNGNERKISYSSVKRFIVNSPDLYSAMIMKNQSLRAIYNADCGMNRRFRSL